MRSRLLLVTGLASIILCACGQKAAESTVQAAPAELLLGRGHIGR